MTKQKSTKRALLLSAVSLLLCASMFVGTTFAWFTDTVSSGRNLIQSGNLDVELYYAATAADVAADKWTKVDSETDVYGYELWEPGHTRIAYFKVANEGSLALKYQLTARVFNETAGKNKIGEGETFLLSDYLYTKVIDLDDTPDRDDILAITDGTPLKGSINLREEAGELVAKGVDENGNPTKSEEIIGLAIWMPTSVGNEANHDGKTIPTIEFGINLVATQLDAEVDSFGKDYDEGAMDNGVKTENDNIIYINTEDGEYILHEVLPAFANDTLNVPAGVTSISNYAFSKNNNVKTVILPSSVTSLGRGFDSSTVEKVVLGKGLEAIDSRAFRSSTALEEVVIPSTVKVIEDNAFQKSGIKEITIPATVETVGETAFGASSIETVIFEGNTSIQGYAFRGCPNLRTVYLYGDDVQFIPSTLNGRNSMWFCNGESNNPNTSNITFYVMNETVAQRVKTAMGAEADNTPVIIMTSVNSADELEAALAAKKSVIALSGNCITDESFVVDYDVTIIGNDTAITRGSNTGTTITREDGYTGAVFTVTAGASLTLENVTVDGGAIWTGDINQTLGRGTVNTGVTATGALIATEGNGKIVLGEGAVLQNNDGSNAISLATRGGGSLTLNGARIINNTSDAGAIWGGDDITINEGTVISGNHATSIGGAFRMVNGNNAITFTMNGGIINNNYTDGNGGAIWGGNNATYIFNGGEMAHNYAAGSGGAIWTGTYEKYTIAGDFKLYDNACAANIGGGIRFCDHASFTMTGGSVYGNTANGQSDAFYLNNNSASITGGSIEDNFSFGGGLGLTWGTADVDGVIAFNLSTNHNTVYLAKEFDIVKFTANEADEHFAYFNFKPAADYVYTEGDEAKLVCLNEGYTTYWNTEKNAFCLKAE